jgi:hypothetical protein
MKETTMQRRSFLFLLGVAAVAPLAGAQSARDATLYKNPQCGCCEDHAKYLRRHGYNVVVVPTHDLDRIKSRNGVPEELYGCHTMLVGGYVVEGHVSAGTLDRLLRERPAIRGISVPGMPPGSPGMTGRKKEPLKTYEIAIRRAGEPRLYATE